jgi:hypothetical protein
MLDASSPGEVLRLEAFMRLSRIERTLRRVLERELATALGKRWARSLPPDIAVKVVDDSLDWLDFPDLKKCIGSKWRDLGTLSACGSKQQLIVHLEELEQIRNAIAHSRDVSPSDLALVRGTYALLEPIIVPEVSAEPAASLGIALLAVRQAVDARAAVQPGDLAAMRANADTTLLAEEVAAYDRLIRRPGVPGRQINDVVITFSDELDDAMANATVPL